MTIQINDRIYLDGKLFELLSFPLDAFFEAHSGIPRFRGKMANCRRGYVASWRLRNNVLYLTGFQQLCPDVFINTTDLLVNPKKVAQWYTGMLRIPMGEVLHHYEDQNDLHEREIRIYLEDGVVANHDIILNKYVPSGKSDNIRS